MRNLNVNFLRSIRISAYKEVKWTENIFDVFISSSPCECERLSNLISVSIQNKRQIMFQFCGKFFVNFIRSIFPSLSDYRAFPARKAHRFNMCSQYININLLCLYIFLFQRFRLLQTKKLPRHIQHQKKILIAALSLLHSFCVWIIIFLFSHVNFSSPAS